MTGPQVDKRVSLGSLINLLGLVVAVAVGWGVMRERGESTRENMTELRDTLRQEVTTRRDGQAALESRMRVVESNLARAEERNNAVLQVLGRIEARLERIEGRQ